MLVKVESCWAGADRHYFRCSFMGDRVRIDNPDGGAWERKHATELRNYIENHYGIDRNKVRIEHH